MFQINFIIAGLVSEPLNQYFKNFEPSKTQHLKFYP